MKNHFFFCRVIFVVFFSSSAFSPYADVACIEKKKRTMYHESAFAWFLWRYDTVLFFLLRLLFFYFFF
jgi:hypothetical protein